jgi:hypothetical protein
MAAALRLSAYALYGEMLIAKCVPINSHLQTQPIYQNFKPTPTPKINPHSS